MTASIIGPTVARRASDWYLSAMLGLTWGELFIVAFVTVTVVSAPWWLRAGEAIAALWMGEDDRTSDVAAPRQERDE